MGSVVPDDDPDDALRAVVRSLAASARESNLARTGVLEEALAALGAGALSVELRDSAVSAAHQVAGSAGTFGKHRSSALAADLEQWFHEVALPGPDPARLDWAHDLLGDLRADLTGDHQDEV
ncbi:hypothetical protein GCM10009616_20210 [Microlunatus lacustris]